MTTKAITKNELTVLVCLYFLDLIDVGKAKKIPDFGEEYLEVLSAIEHIREMPEVIHKEDIERLWEPILDDIAGDWEFYMAALQANNNKTKNIFKIIPVKRITTATYNEALAGVNQRAELLKEHGINTYIKEGSTDYRWEVNLADWSGEPNAIYLCNEKTNEEEFACAYWE